MKEALKSPFFIGPIPTPPWLAKAESENADRAVAGGIDFSRAGC